MKALKMIFKKSLCLFFCFAFFLGAYAFITPKFSKTNSSFATPTSSASATSMFLKSPTFSTVFENKVYFLDSSDNLLKIYDFQSEACLNSCISFASTPNIADVAFLDGVMFVLASNETSQSLVIVDLANFNTRVLDNSLFLTPFERISATLITDSAEKVFAISLVPESPSNAPIVLLINKSTLELESSCEVSIGSTFSELKSNLFKFFVIDSISNKLDIIFFFNSKVAFSTLSITALKNNETINTVTNIEIEFENIDTDIVMQNVNMMTLSSKQYFLISYLDSTDSQTNGSTKSYSFLYKFFIDDSTNSYFSIVGTQSNPLRTKVFLNENSNYLLTSNNLAVYPKSNQTICIYNIELEGEYFKPSPSKTIVQNPEIFIDEFSADDFVYMKTNADSFLFESPWSPTAKLKINNGNDVICVGNAYFRSKNSTSTEYTKNYINDFKFCLFTAILNGEAKNITGYISSSTLSPKTDEDTESCPSYFKVVPETKLYSLPTKVAGEISGTRNLVSTSSNINENFRIKLSNTIYSYKSLQSVMVQVDYEGKIGYIEKSNIIFPNEKIDFIVTNSSIKNDNTVVYTNLETKEELNFKLNKGDRVKIDGKRDTKSGYTAVSFNDEYGNEYNGYISTDILSTDSWSTLQIVGSILIAINIGLLILILRFRKQKIGRNGQKYSRSQKPNYTKATITPSSSQKSDEPSLPALSEGVDASQDETKLN